MEKGKKIIKTDFEKEPYWPHIVLTIGAILLLLILVFSIRYLRSEAHGTPAPTTEKLVYYPRKNIQGLEERQRILEKTLASAWEIALKPGNILPKKIMILIKSRYCLAAPYGESDFLETDIPSGSDGSLPIIPLLPGDKSQGGVWAELESMRSPGGFSFDLNQYIILGSVPLSKFWRGLIFLSISRLAFRDLGWIQSDQSSDEFENDIIMNSSNGEAFRKIIQEESERIKDYYLEFHDIPKPNFLNFEKLNVLFGPAASNEELEIRCSLLFMRIIARLSLQYPELREIYSANSRK
jgi:hypothetical protein